MKFLIKSIIMSALFILLTHNPSSTLEAAESGAGLPECTKGDGSTCSEEIKYDSDCLKEENSCPVEFLESILCVERPYLCPGESSYGNFSWAKLVVIHADVMYEFGLPSQAEIDEYTDHEDEISDFIDHEALEFVICRFDSEKPSDKKVCEDGSLYEPKKNCLNPRLCTDAETDK